MTSSMMETVRCVTPLKKLHHKPSDDRRSLQQTSVNLVVVQALNAIQIVKNTTTPSNIHPEAIPDSLFRWTQEQQRPPGSFNNVWYQMLLKHYDEESVEIEKFQIDVNEMTAFMLLILNNYIDNCDPDETQSLLDEAIKYVTYYEKWNKGMEDYRNWMYTKQAFDFITLLKKSSKRKPLNPDELNIDDIKMRARLKYEDSRRCQMELRLGLAERELIDKISQEKDILRNEDKCNSLMLNAYYGYQDELRQQYAKREKIYLALEEQTTHTIEILKTNLQRLKDSYEFHQEEYKHIIKKMSMLNSIDDAHAIKLALLDRRLTSKRFLVPKSSFRIIKVKKVKNSIKP